jgi:hypothetical protein
MLERWTTRTRKRECATKCKHLKPQSLKPQRIHYYLKTIRIARQSNACNLVRCLQQLAAVHYTVTIADSTDLHELGGNRISK